MGVGLPQDGACKEFKTELARLTMLALYNRDAPTKISADVSPYGLGAVLFQQQHDDKWKPVAFTSQTMTETERRFSQIEKKVLALVWACEKFSDYSIRKSILLETDHKPPVPLLGKTSLDYM